MDTESKLFGLLTNDPSEPFEVPDFDCRVVFKRPSIAQKHKGRAWSFRKLKEYGYDSNEEHSGTRMLQFWGQLNSFVLKILVDGGREYPFDPKVDIDYSSVFEKYTVEEVYNKMGIQEDIFIAQVVTLLFNWVEDTSAKEEELKNS